MTLQQLIEKASVQSLSEQERENMQSLISSESAERVISGMSDAILATLDAQPMEKTLADSMLSVIMDDDKQNTGARTVHRLHFLKTPWFRYAAAIIILFGIGAYLWNTQNNSRTITQTQPVPVKDDVLPGSNKAILTLGDGRQVQLDSTANALLAEKGITNDNALLVYGNKGEANILNTLATPKGGQYQVKLGDGTMVWLNAASSITYPTTFTGNTREVSVTGEVYFEVAKNKSKPFIAKTGKENITVLGTSFNVNSYKDEPAAKISLINGSVKVNEKILQPGQAYVEGEVVSTDMQLDIAWKNGAFNFNGTPLSSAMNQLARWYDVEIHYENGIPDIRFGGKMGRDLTLGQVLRALDAMGLQFSIEGKHLTVKK